jgi:hypothetical protein
MDDGFEIMDDGFEIMDDGFEIMDYIFWNTQNVFPWKVVYSRNF